MWSILNREYKAIDHIIDVTHTSGTHTSSKQGQNAALRKQARTYALGQQGEETLPHENRAASPKQGQTVKKCDEING